MRKSSKRTRLLLRLSVLAIGVAGAAPALAQARFGVSSFDMSLSSSQAGAHANQTTSLSVNTEALGNPIGQLNDVTVTLPEGLNGNPQAIPRCPMRSFNGFNCPSSTQVGLLEPDLLVCVGMSEPLTAEALAGETKVTVTRANRFCQNEKAEGGWGPITIGSGPTAETARFIENSGTTLELSAPLKYNHATSEPVIQTTKPIGLPLPLFNLQPQPGHVATFGTMVLFSPIIVNIDVAEGGAGGLKATITNASTLLPVTGTAMTLWGVPSAPTHDAQRCVELLAGECNLPAGDPVPFMTNPSNCTDSLQSTLSVSSYEGESATAKTELAAPTGCEALHLASSVLVAPDTTRRDAPAGYEVDLKVPQSEQPEALATPDVRNVSVTLPSGTSLSPAMANGLQACSEAQFGADGCPNASKVGTAEITTPILAEKLTGAVYIGQPTATEKYPLRASLSAGAVTIRLFGQAEPNTATGQVTTVFTNAPQLPFSDFKLNMFGGPMAVLANPTACGPATSSAAVSSYGGQTATASSTFVVDANGGACPAPSFSPKFSAGTTSPQAAGFSPFTLTVSRADGEPSLSSFSAQLPPGLLGLLKSVPLCPEPQASQGTCGAASEVGAATILAGAGTQPLPVSGPAYLTGPYDGAPFGLAVVINAAAGPFDLGTAIVRSRIYIDPGDLHLSIVSDPFPQIMGGIPLRMRTVNVTFSRPGFMFNPSSCVAQTVSATIAGVDGESSLVSSPFRVAGCESLSFTPRLTASTQAGASLGGNGAGLSVKIVNPVGSFGTMHVASIQMPTQLRPRLATIQHACLATRPVTSASACGTESLVGHATVVSPVMAAPLSGPVYLVAHGGTAPPSLVLLLQGGGVSVDLTAALSISSLGPITAVFQTLPDVPISTFELMLPGGPRSMLGATTNVCKKPLKIPYKLTDQGGRLVSSSATIQVAGCAKHRATGKAARPNRRKRAKEAADTGRRRARSHHNPQRGRA